MRFIPMVAIALGVLAGCSDPQTGSSTAGGDEHNAPSNPNRVDERQVNPYGQYSPAQTGGGQQGLPDASAETEDRMPGTQDAPARDDARGDWRRRNDQAP